MLFNISRLELCKIASDESRAEEKAEKEAIKLCIDCKYCLPNPTVSHVNYSHCVHPRLPVRYDMISGDRLLNYCSSQRVTGDNYCGAEAQFFQQKEKENDK